MVVLPQWNIFRSWTWFTISYNHDPVTKDPWEPTCLKESLDMFEEPRLVPGADLVQLAGLAAVDQVAGHHDRLVVNREIKYKTIKCVGWAVLLTSLF